MDETWTYQWWVGESVGSKLKSKTNTKTYWYLIRTFKLTCLTIGRKWVFLKKNKKTSQHSNCQPILIFGWKSSQPNKLQFVVWPHSCREFLTTEIFSFGLPRVRREMRKCCHWLFARDHHIFKNWSKDRWKWWNASKTYLINDIINAFSFCCILWWFSKGNLWRPQSEAQDAIEKNCIFCFFWAKLLSQRHFSIQEILRN